MVDWLHNDNKRLDAVKKLWDAYDFLCFWVRGSGTGEPPMHLLDALNQFDAPVAPWHPDNAPRLDSIIEPVDVVDFAIDATNCGMMKDTFESWAAFVQEQILAHDNKDVHPSWCPIPTVFKCFITVLCDKFGVNRIDGPSKEVIDQWILDVIKALEEREADRQRRVRAAPFLDVATDPVGDWDENEYEKVW